MKIIKIKNSQILDWYDAPLSYYCQDQDDKHYYSIWVDNNADNGARMFLLAEINLEDIIDPHNLFQNGTCFYLSMDYIDDGYVLEPYTGKISEDWIPFEHEESRTYQEMLDEARKNRSQKE